jgi:hypothetical protein
MPMTQKGRIKLLKSEGWTREPGGKHQTKLTKPGHRPITLPRTVAAPTAKACAYGKGFEPALRRQAEPARI